MEAARKRGLLIGKGGLYANSLRIAPPMIVNKGQIDDAIRLLAEALAEALTP
jgi:4-aminobutyrate aminotransferase-like enzyme